MPQSPIEWIFTEKLQALLGRHVLFCGPQISCFKYAGVKNIKLNIFVLFDLPSLFCDVVFYTAVIGFRINLPMRVWSSADDRLCVFRKKTCFCLYYL